MQNSGLDACLSPCAPLPSLYTQTRSWRSVQAAQLHDEDRISGETVPQQTGNNKHRSCQVRIKIPCWGITNSSHSTAGLLEEFMVNSLVTCKHHSQTAGVPKIAEKQEPTPKDEDSKMLKLRPSTWPRTGGKINHDILLEGDSQRRQTPGIRKKRKNTRYNRWRLSTVPTLYS